MSRFACRGVLALLAGLLPNLALESVAQEKAITIKRRHEFTEDDLRKMLNDPIPELGLNQAGAKLVYDQISVANKKKFPVSPDVGFNMYQSWAKSIGQEEKWTSLPWRPGQDSQLGLETAKRLQVLSVNLRRYMRESVSGQDTVRPNPKRLRAKLTGSQALEWDQPESVPTLMQMLQPEDSPLRALLVEVLSNIKGKEASVALAQRAVFDLSPVIREQAVRALGDRPRKEFQKVLADSLRYPWAPAADHAAEAISALRMTELQGDLVQMLKEPAPGLPFEGEVKGFKSPVVREMVRVNHLSNCCLCHALSTAAADFVRGRVPTPGQEMREPYYGADTTGTFVRADVTFLRQDFSVPQPVVNPLKWAGHQRFDYLVRTRKANPTEASQLRRMQISKKVDEPYPQREAVLFALRELTGRDLGSSSESWAPLQRATVPSTAPKKE